MTRAVAFGLALLTAAFLGRGYVSEVKATPSWRMDECRYQSLQQGTWTPLEEHLTAVCVTSRWSVSGGLSTLDRIVACESGWNRLAIGGSGNRYVGLAQHALSAWPSRFRSYVPQAWEASPRWQNSRTMLIVTAHMMADVGTSPWSCA